MTNKLEQNADRAKMIVRIFWVMLALSLISIASNFMQYKLLTNPNGISDELADLNDDRQQIIGIIQVIGFFVTCVFFVRWFKRAYANLHKIDSKGLGYDENAAVVSWFIPFLNLVRPYKIMNEIWIETQRRKPGYVKVKSTSLIGWWWAGWVLLNIIGQVSSRLALSAKTIEALRFSSLTLLLSDSIEIINIITIINLIQKISQFETELYQSWENSAQSQEDNFSQNRISE